MNRKATFALVLSILTAASSALAGNDAAIRFNREIRPIFTENCFACHGPDPAGRKEGLRFDRAEGFFTERKDGTPVVKGDPAEEPAVSADYQQRQRRDHAAGQVTQGADWRAEGPDQAVDRAGCRWEAHWSWIVPVKAPLPAVKNPAWVRNPIDQFILAKLDEKGLTPAPRPIGGR